MKNWNQTVVIGLSIIIAFALHGYIVSRAKVTKGFLNGAILLKKNSTSQLSTDGIGVDGSKVELYEDYVIVSYFRPNDKNQSKVVYSWDDIYSIPLK